MFATVTATERVEALRIGETPLRSVFGADSVSVQPLRAIIDQYSRVSDETVGVGL